MVHPTSVTNVDRPARRGRASSSRRPNPDDGRGVLAAITDAGRAVVEAATADLVRRSTSALGDLLDDGRARATLLRRRCKRVRLGAGDVVAASRDGSAAR